MIINFPSCNRILISTSSGLPNIRKLKNTKGFALWIINVTEGVWNEGVATVLIEDPHASQKLTAPRPNTHRQKVQQDVRILF